MFLFGLEVNHLKQDIGKNWLQTFHHNSNFGEWFHTEEELLSRNIRQIQQLAEKIYFPLEVKQINHSVDAGYKLCQDFYCSWNNYNWNGLSMSDAETEIFIVGNIHCHIFSFGNSIIHIKAFTSLADSFFFGIITFGFGI